VSSVMLADHVDDDRKPKGIEELKPPVNEMVALPYPDATA